MSKLKPTYPKLLQFYVDHSVEFHRLSDELGRVRFSPLLRKSLKEALKNGQGVDLVEAVVRVGGYEDHREIARQRRDVSRSFSRDGIRLPKGKRPAPELEKLVEDIAPLLLHFGVPLATGEGSKLVSLLRLIASECSVRGDPRDELRRVRRLEKEQERAAKKAVLEAVARGLEPLRRLFSQPPP